MKKLTVQTTAWRELHDITDRVTQSCDADGVWLIYVPHTTAGVTINEGADPAVARDVIAALEAMVPEDLRYEHAEGNSPAHVLVSLTGSSVLLAVEKGKPQLGRWQAVFLCEFDGPRSREVWLHRL
ncbi:MAG: secondary thiamine-phosphate synthase enzyme YjbQ [Gemmatimonadota bacterium]